MNKKQTLHNLLLLREWHWFVSGRRRGRVANETEDEAKQFNIMRKKILFEEKKIRVNS